jgi:hypothetical protein
MAEINTENLWRLLHARNIVNLFEYASRNANEIYNTTIRNLRKFPEIKYDIFTANINNVNLIVSGFYINLITNYGDPLLERLHVSFHNAPGIPSQSHIKFNDVNTPIGYQNNVVINILFNPYYDHTGQRNREGDTISLVVNDDEMNDYLLLIGIGNDATRDGIREHLKLILVNISIILTWIIQRAPIETDTLVPGRAASNALGEKYKYTEPPLGGGANVESDQSSIYYAKYLKYKQKYLELKTLLKK